MRSAALALALVIGLGAGVARAAPDETSVQIGEGAQTLHGSLIPARNGEPGPAVVLIAGSGPEDRNGDDLKAGQRSHTLQLLAQALAEHGIASLRYDKRGAGESAAAGQPASVDALAADAAGWARFLRGRPGVSCVVLVGHSEGALIATLAARKVKLCGLVLVSGTARTFADLVESQSALAGRSAADSARLHEIILAVRAGKPPGEIPRNLMGVFGPDALAYTRSQLDLDPAAALARVKVPVLVVQGDNDLQVQVADAERLAAVHGEKPVVIPGANHVLKIAPRQTVGNFMTYLNPNLPLAPGIADAIAGFVQSRRP
jgi:pimeloyl-ACP methyl ester carboxylesterase